MGASVTSLKTNEKLCREDVAKLVKCSNLEELGISLTRDAESSLMGAVLFMTNLRSLKLDWSSVRLEECQDEWYPGWKYYEAVSGTTLKVVQVSPMLAELSMVGVRIAVGEIAAILKSIGPRLKHFETTTAGQGDSPFDSLEKLMETMIVHNPQLSTFNVYSKSVEGAPRTSGVVAISQQGRRIRYVLARLKRRAPMLRTCDLNRYLDAHSGRD